MQICGEIGRQSVHTLYIERSHMTWSNNIAYGQKLASCLHIFGNVKSQGKPSKLQLVTIVQMISIHALKIVRFDLVLHTSLTHS